MGRTLALVLIVALTLAACGRKGDLRPAPEDENSPYPRAYPSATDR
jgi:predicted small lipoprotein YifL